MRFLLILAALAAPAATAPLSAPATSEPAAPVAPALAQPPAGCPPTPAQLAAEHRDQVQVRNLNELPPANAYAAVYREIEGCEAPVVIRYDVGNPLERPTRE